ncbi:DUF4239 domain-containing protein [Rhizobium sp. Root1220]|uniref:bestrophin-like domain n=1 Tax=Rhizobium sp. Root1220 TaxID=1736432 RepID=UPI0006FEC7F7|nr:DUF4239 domain-containing protein [Rhizobium sp. Root1220]KQV80018.1 hypothetical protein ASC90_25795 [Rhizobium sp. Root1220]
MNALETGIMVTLLLIGASLIGAGLSRRLPDHHLSVDSKEAIKLATAVVGTLSALAVGFLIASAKTTFDTAQQELKTSAARLVLLDRVMVQYGDETKEARRQLTALVYARLNQTWGGLQETQHSADDDLGIEPVQRTLRALVPHDDAQKLIRDRAIEVSGQIAEAHWLVVEAGNEGLPTAFLVVLVFWLALLFMTFGLLSPRNATVLCIVSVCAVSVGGAIFVINDMAHPYHGIIYVSDEPLRFALGRIDATR